MSEVLLPGPAPLDVLITLVPSLYPESIDPDHLGTAPDQPICGEHSLLAALNSIASAPAMPGSLKGALPEDVYVFAQGTDPAQIIRFGRLGWGNKCHVVTSHFKAVIEKLPATHSEFHPVSVVYRDPAGVLELGGGAVVRDFYWLWYCYAVHDLIDIRHSRAVFHRTSEPRLDVAGHPEITFNIVGGEPADGPRSLTLGRVPYDDDAAFHILGLWSVAPFASPDLVRLLHGAEPEHRFLLPQVAPHILDQQRAYEVRQVPEEGKLPLRVVGTDWLIRDEYEPPFYPERPHFAGV